MSTTFYNTFSITISYSKNFGAFSATKSIPNGDFGLPKFWRILKHMYIERTECVPKDDFGFPKFWYLQLKVRDEKNLPVLKTTSGSTKILAYLKTNGYGKNRMRSQRRLWPCVGRRPESDPAGGVFGNTFGSLTYSVFKYRHQNFYLVQTSSSEFVQ